MIEIPIKRREPVMRWIPCSERLPEVGRCVLLSVGGLYTAEGCLRDDGDWNQFRWDAIQRKDMVGAWMPLPEPYNGQGKHNSGRTVIQMTKAEAIRILEQSCPKRPQKLWSIKRKEAVKMAIEALHNDIVRCKDCKYWKHTNGSFGRCCYEYWDENERFRTYIERFCEDYCSDGERGDADDEQ